jgi:hypothetical protein
VGDVGEGASVHEHWRRLQGLHEGTAHTRRYMHTRTRSAQYTLKYAHMHTQHRASRKIDAHLFPQARHSDPNHLHS